MCARLRLSSLMLLLPAAALALGPHEVLVLANESSPQSVAIAKAFARLRGVPAPNLLRLRLPAAFTNSPCTISPEDFSRAIWVPAARAVRDRGLERQILAWVYSVDFPVRIGTTPPISIQGLTFLRNRTPTTGEVDDARYISPLFAGPSQPAAVGSDPQSFDALAEWLGAEMPLPSMMLGYTGERGNTPQQVLACLEQGARADGSAPTGTVYFVTSGDIRSKCRDWQYPAAVAELSGIGLAARITDQFPAGRTDVMGVMLGAADARPDRIAVFRPGALGEQLTSAGAVFHSGNQTKLSAWIAAGATASCGTVSEPYARWAKFPHARCYAHYAAGCTLIESLYQALRCPLQIMLVGDPLAAPWGPRDKLAIRGLPGDAVSGAVTVRGEPDAAAAHRYRQEQEYLVDGRVVGRGEKLQLDTRELADGPHTLRVVARRRGLVRSQVFAEQEIKVRNRTGN